MNKHLIGQKHIIYTALSHYHAANYHIVTHINHRAAFNNLPQKGLIMTREIIFGLIFLVAAGLLARVVTGRFYIQNLNLTPKTIKQWFKKHTKTLQIITIALLLTATAGIAAQTLQRRRGHTMLNQLRYANEMWLDLRIVVDGEEINDSFHTIRDHINPDYSAFAPGIRRFRFVHSEAEATALSSRTIAAWPRNNHWPHSLAAGINWAVNRDEADLAHFIHGQIRDVICLTDFGLTYPLTVEDKIDSWEAVSALWQAFPQNERSDIRRFAAAYAINE